MVKRVKCGRRDRKRGERVILEGELVSSESDLSEETVHSAPFYPWEEGKIESWAESSKQVGMCEREKDRSASRLEGRK